MICPRPRCGCRLMEEVDHHHFRSYRCIYHGEVTLHPSVLPDPEAANAAAARQAPKE